MGSALTRSRFKAGKGNRAGGDKSQSSTGFAFDDVQYQLPGPHFNLGTQVLSADGKSLAAGLGNGSGVNSFGGYGATVVMSDGSQRNWSFGLSYGIVRGGATASRRRAGDDVAELRGWFCRSADNSKPAIGIRPS